MNLEITNFPQKIERAIEWRVEKIIKKRKASRKKTKQHAGSRTKKNHAHPFASQKRTQWSESWYHHPLESNKIFYESFSGNGALCNPRAIFEYLLTNEKYANYQHVWALRNSEDRKSFDDQYSEYPNVKTVEYSSTEYFKQLSTSKFLFNNATFPPAFAKRKNQIYVNTWHGTPLKTMGYDMPNGPRESANILRNFVSADYLLSPNSHTTKVMYLDAYRLQGVYAGSILEEGYPRIDAHFASDHKIKLTKQSILNELGRFDYDKKLVVYAPTWKGNSFHSPTDEAQVLLDRIQRLKESHGDEYQFLLKVHQRVFDVAKENESVRQYLIPNGIPTNEILAITDVLITDYSSIFFDYLTTRLPIIFFTPDREDYSLGRGTYLEPAALPGPVIHELDDLNDVFENLFSGNSNDVALQYSSARESAAGKYTSKEDGLSCSRIVDIVLNNSKAYKEVVSENEGNKQTLLIFLGGMLSNGITSSALNLLHNIDYNRFDVSVLVPSPPQKSDTALYERIDPRVRQFMRSGSFPATVDHLIENETFLNGENNKYKEASNLTHETFQAEWQRLFGDISFDHIVDFSGYSGFWSHILAKGPAKTHTVWMHNNLIADSERKVGDVYPNRKGLNSQFNAYKYYDRFISVSAALEEINAEFLGEFGSRDQFGSVSNTLDVHYISEQAFGTTLSRETNIVRSLTESQSLHDDVSKLASVNDIRTIKSLVDKEYRIQQLVGTDDDLITFVTAGRLSPEKNHARLIEAFAKAKVEHPNIRLLILGNGPLKPELEMLSKHLAVDKFVTLAGHVSNPFEIMARADCFVLSSDYEGQPMVILEALALGLPVLTVEFGSVSSAIKPGQGWVVPQTVEDLSFGLSQFAAGTLVRTRGFDSTEFNAMAMTDFYSAIGVVS